MQLLESRAHDEAAYGAIIDRLVQPGERLVEVPEPVYTTAMWNRRFQYVRAEKRVEEWITRLRTRAQGGNGGRGTSG